MSRIISIGGGKGGVGKTLTALHLARMMQWKGARVLVIDADLGLANCDVLLNLKSRYTIEDVVEGHCSFDQVVCDSGYHFDIIPAKSGVGSLADLSKLERMELIEEFKKFYPKYDYIFIDTGAGIHAQVMDFNHMASYHLVVSSPEPHAVTDAYAFMKTMVANNQQNNMAFIINLSRDPEESLKIFRRVAEVCQSFLKTKIEYLGAVPFDSSIPRAIMNRDVISDLMIHTLAGQAYKELANRLCEWTGASDLIEPIRRSSQDSLLRSV